MIVLSCNFGFSKSNGQSLTNTDTHILLLEKPKLHDNMITFLDIRISVHERFG